MPTFFYLLLALVTMVTLMASGLKATIGLRREMPSSLAIRGMSTSVQTMWIMAITAALVSQCALLFLVNDKYVGMENPSAMADFFVLWSLSVGW